MVNIRAMHADDIAEAAALEEKIFSMPWSRQGFLAALDRSDTVYLAAEEQGKIAGYIGMYFSMDEGEITNVAVDPLKRCRGIGAGLIREIKRQAELRSLTRIVLEVRVSNEAAIRLYETNGFAKRGIRKGFYDMPKEDAYIMIYGQ